MSSLDPRINRLGLSEDTLAFTHSSYEGAPFELLWMPKPGKPYEHVGIVHAADLDLALLYAKEQYSRRGGNCYGLMAFSSADVWASPTTDDGRNAFDALETLPVESFLNQEIVVFTSKKRGKHHQVQGRVTSASVEDFKAMLQGMRSEPCVSLWLVPESDTASLEAGPEGLWKTLPDKQYRDAIAYKAGDKIKAFAESRKQNG